MSYILGFEQYLERADKSPNTKKAYLSDVEKFVSWCEGEKSSPFRITDVTPTDIKTYRNYLRDDCNQKPTSINRRIGALGALFSWAVECQIMLDNPTRYVKQISTVDLSPRYLDEQEKYKLIQAIEKNLLYAKSKSPETWLIERRNASLTIFMMNVGLRVGEVVENKFGHFKLSQRKGVVFVPKGKGSKARHVPLNKMARNVLASWIEVFPNDLDRDYLWVGLKNSRGNKLSVRSIQRIVSSYGRQAGIDLTPHTLRHTFAKSLIDQGVGLEVVATLLGHSNLNTTRIYITPNERDLANAVEKIDW